MKTRALLCILASCVLVPALSAATKTITFSKGLNGYGSVVETELSEGQSTINFKVNIHHGNVRGKNGKKSAKQTLLRFDNIFGKARNQIPPDATITKAVLHIEIGTSPSNISQSPSHLHRILVPWEKSAAWKDKSWGGNGLQPDDREAAKKPDASVTFAENKTGYDIDVTKSLQTWAKGAPNYGWLFLLESKEVDHVGFVSSNGGNALQRPKLIVTFDAPESGEPEAATVAIDNTVPITTSSGAVIQFDPTTSLAFFRKAEFPLFLAEHCRLTTEAMWKTFDLHPPTTNPSPERWLALYALDGLLHDERLDTANNAFQKLHEAAGQRILAQLKQPRPKSGFRIHKLYSSGIIIQTATATIGIDLVRGGIVRNYDNNKLVSDNLIKEIASHLDILLVTHYHRDHADLLVAESLAEKSRPAVVPPKLWENVSPNILHLRDETREFPLSGSNVPLRVRIHPGIQKSRNPANDALNNVYEITTPEGFTFVHTGDFWVDGEKKNELIARIGEGKKVDLLFSACWAIRYSKEFSDAVNRMNPALVIATHENELGHTGRSREPFWLNQRGFALLKAPSIFIAPGETYRQEDGNP